MGSRLRFTAVLLAWVGALTIALIGFALTVVRPDLIAAKIVTALAAAAALAGLVRHLQRTNTSVARFVEALRHGDYSARFAEAGGAGFDEIGRAFSNAMRQLQAERTRDTEELRFWAALVDDMPVALLTVDEVHGVRPANAMAGRLFDRHEGSRPSDFAIYGDELAALLADGSEPIAYRLIDLELAGGRQRAILRAATVARLGARTRVVTVEPVQSTLDAVEIGAQADLVRVLTHEILNSLTPVTSLAGTAVVLLGEEEPDLTEARLAVGTLARRTEGLRRFIDSYRAVARPPEPRRRRFAAAPFAAELARLFTVEWIEHELVVDVAPDVTLDADPDLLAQALINLMRNAAQATQSAAQPVIRLAIAQEADGAVIEVEDNGAGIPKAIRGDVFLPFFTTRSAGTGVGLNLVRQIVVAHAARIEIRDSTLGGALFRLSGF